VFRAIWLAALASNIGTLMQGVASALLMTSLTTSPVPVALLTTMANLPLLLVGLHAGALADLIDRRWLVLVTQVWMLAVAALLGALTALGLTTPTLLLMLTFLIGLGGALSAPAWQAIMPELVPRRELATAVALNSAGFNLARAVGPAIGGLLVAAAGPATVFLLNAASFLGIIAVIYWWKPPPREQPAMPERVNSAIAAGLRFTRFAPALRAVLVRTFVFIFPASALWALLPVVATNQLGLGALGYGVLLGSIGLGAVGGAALLPRLRARLSVNRLVALLTLAFAAGLCALALLRNLVALNAVLLIVGMGWLTINSFLNVSAQTNAPTWVQARAVGVYLLVSQGGLAGGSAVWGLVADYPACAQRWSSRRSCWQAAV
jgi:MFS family permease